MAASAAGTGGSAGTSSPAVIIAEVIWLRFQFTLSLRDIPALLATRGA